MVIHLVYRPRKKREKREKREEEAGFLFVKNDGIKATKDVPSLKCCESFKIMYMSSHVLR